MGKQIPILDALLTVQDISAYYMRNPLPVSIASTVFPAVETDQKTWKTQSNLSEITNEAADPISSLSSVPVAGRPGYKDVMGGMLEFGKGREMDADDIEKFEELKRNFAKLKNPQAAQQLIDFYGDDLTFVRTAMVSQMAQMSWSLVSNACDFELVEANSPYLKGLAVMSYGVEAWQKDAVATSWSDPTSLILDDIESVLDAGDTYKKSYQFIYINKKWFGYVRKNEQVQKQCATLAANLFNTQTRPTTEAVNTMLNEYFDTTVKFIVVDEKITRASATDVKTTANPFADGVAVFSQQAQLGHFEWKKLAITDTTKEVYESFFVVGNYKQIDPSYSKIYTKGKGFPVIDTYPDNFYLRVNAVAWA